MQTKSWSVPAATLVALTLAGPARAGVMVQCPGDTNGDAVIDKRSTYHPNARCVHLTGGDGYITMGDGRPMYIFGFSNVTGMRPDQVMNAGLLAASFPAPTIAVDQGDELYITLTNVGMAMRPDLFDPHTVHFHGFPNAAAVFDGIPETSIAINMGASMTYYYRLTEPGTYLYHCHAEATEHMQMGMLGNLYVRPAQNRLPDGTPLKDHVHRNPDWNADRNADDPLLGDKYAYNDGDGSTRYDVEYAIQLGSFDPRFHDASETVQTLPFADMRDTYSMINGRGYPLTKQAGALPAPAENGGKTSQPMSSLIEASRGQRVLLRLTNVSVTNLYTLGTLGLPLRVIGRGAQLLRGGGSKNGKDLSYATRSVTLGGGESVDVIIDTAGVSRGRYFLYTTNLQYLSNDREDLGGMMTEIVVN